MALRIRRRITRFIASVVRLWRLATCAVCAYRLKVDGKASQVGRVIDVQVRGEHVYLTDIDGRTYLYRLDEVQSLAPVRAREPRRMLQPLPVVA